MTSIGRRLTNEANCIPCKDMPLCSQASDVLGHARDKCVDSERSLDCCVEFTKEHKFSRVFCGKGTC